MTITVRFAPSPTGNIHIGNARTALINWIYARQNAGSFILRYDDTDKARSKQEYADGIARDLAWLGIKPDRVERQSERSEAHEAATQKLKDSGLLYACYETADELDRQRKRLAMRGLPPVYNRAGLSYNAEELAKFEDEGRKPHWRFLLPNHKGDPSQPERTEIHWDDLVRGPQTVDLASLSDPVLIREDGSWLYTLPSVVDDIDMGVTHIIRGDDHVTNTGVQIAIFEALGATAPGFGHHNLLTTASGEGLSKRLGSLSLQALAEDHYEPMAVASLATLIGTSGPVEAVATMDELISRFDIASVTKSAAKFDVSELDKLNAKLVHELSFGAVADRLTVAGAVGDEAFWLAVRGNLDKVEDAAFWWQKIENAAPQIDAEDTEFVQTAAGLLPAEPWDETTWGTWTAAVKEVTGRKGKGLFMPLRKALTGESHGPELAAILPLIGRERTLARLS
ncbi:MAG: glutamate--tRNA ligase [Nitratireductor sp.]|nr:glutamate--tRNA ligase [Nitratireductor sp.]